MVVRRQHRSTTDCQDRAGASQFCQNKTTDKELKSLPSDRFWRPVMRDANGSG
ncbi:hypothetical protein [Chamaesiphon minutus]|uniref:hypothetical protein n=1 Tax=Chamaesiphon minutus TaxID=1173032 RepID=UPI0002EF1F93|nr:hypothetical protein [Chamaesiphon minutus]